MSIKKISISLAVLVAAVAGVLATANPARAAVNVYVNGGGDLIINGDDGDQDVWVESTAQGIEVVFKRDGVDATFEVADFSRDLIVNLGGGNDSIHWLPRAGIRQVRVDLGSGDNYAFLSRMEVHDYLSIKDGTGSSAVNTDGVYGYDAVAEIDLGNGNNIYRDRNSTFWKHNVKNGGTGSLEYELEYTRVFGEVTVTGSNKRDDIEFTRVRTRAASVRLDLKGGNDWITTRRADMGQAIINQGGGNDKFISSVTKWGAIDFRGNGGVDMVATFGSTYRGAASFNGGAGKDNIDGEQNTFAQPPTIISFP